MTNFFKSKIRYEKTFEDGTQRFVTDEFLVDALSFTEAEARTIEETKYYIPGEINIVDISRYNIAEAFFNRTGDKYFRARLYFISLDEKSGREKKEGVYFLIQADNIDEAKTIIEEEMKKTLADYSIQKIEETKIIDVFQYNE
jgi:hypothetical protein